MCAIDIKPMIDIDTIYTIQMTSVGSIVLHVSFAEYCLFYRALLQMSPMYR